MFGKWNMQWKFCFYLRWTHSTNFSFLFIIRLLRLIHFSFFPLAFEFCSDTLHQYFSFLKFTLFKNVHENIFLFAGQSFTLSFYMNPISGPPMTSTFSPGHQALDVKVYPRPCLLSICEQELGLLKLTVDR